MADRLLEMLQSKPLVMGDGAMGTMLQQAGLTDGGAPELWNVKRPDVVRAIYQGYADAGSDYITTNSFGGTSYRLKLHKLQDQVFELNRAAAALAREVAGADRLVAGSVGPTGELMEPLGTLTIAEARAGFARQPDQPAGGDRGLDLAGFGVHHHKVGALAGGQCAAVIQSHDPRRGGRDQFPRFGEGFHAGFGKLPCGGGERRVVIVGHQSGAETVRDQPHGRNIAGLRAAAHDVGGAHDNRIAIGAGDRGGVHAGRWCWDRRGGHGGAGRSRDLRHSVG